MHILRIVLFIAIANAAGLIGTYFTIDAIPTWYAFLQKPSFAPPNWIFGPVWTTLYTLMGTAAYFVWRERTRLTHAARGMRLYWSQLALNALWTPVFFGAKSMFAAFIIIVSLAVLIALTINEFRKVNVWSTAALLPYLAWVSFASVLNYELWRLN